MGQRREKNGDGPAQGEFGPNGDFLFFPLFFLFIFEFLNLNPNLIANFEFELDVLVQDVDMK
jgi:hypothetical protein